MAMNKYIKEVVGMRIKLFVFTVSVFLSSATFAGNLDIPHSFGSGSAAKSSEVNSNFTAIENAVNDNDTRISDNSNKIETNLQNLSSQIQSNTTDIENQTATGTIYCEKSGSITGDQGGYTFDFTLEDCGGTLPNENYIGVGIRFDICNGFVTWRVNQHPEVGVSIYSYGPCGSYTFSALYIRVQ